MNNIKLSATRKLVVLLIAVFTYVSTVTAQSVSMTINNCAVTAPNELQFDISFTNLTAANIFHWNSTVIRLSYSTGFLVSTADAVVWGYVSGSDFPLSLPPSASPVFTSNPAGATKMQLQTGNAIYNNTGCAGPSIAPGATAKIGRFFLRDNTNPFVGGQSVGLTWITSSGLVLYLDCATLVSNYNTALTRTLNPPCSLTIPAGCTSPTVGSNPSDQSVCTSGIATFTGSFLGGSPVPTTIWQVQTGGVGLFSDLTETAPYSGTATGTLTITNPNLSLSTNRYRIRANNTCGDVFTNSALLTVNPNVTAGTVSGTSPLCIGATPTYSSTGTAGGSWSSTFPLIASVNPVSGLVTALAAGSTDITYTVNSGCGSPVSSFQSLTVNPNVTAGTVSGTSPLCIGATPTYSSTGTGGGSWSSTFPLIASVNPVSGLVTALAAGSTDITYTVNTGCGSPVSSFQSLTVSPNVTAGTVSGTSPLCIGATPTYSSTGTAGGSWSSTFPLIASVNPVSGLVTALAAGSTNITYTVNSGCGSPVSSFQSLTVSPNANTGTVSGTSPICISNTTAYTSNGDPGGVWSSTNTAVATVNAGGIVTALAAGTSDIRYTISTGCAAFSFKTITVTPFTALAGTTGGAQVCSNTTVLAGGSSFSDGSCNLIAKVVPSGGAPVSGSINTCVRVEDVVHTYQTAPYVQRVYDIEPATNAANATATITLYYTQAEFTAYNLARGAYNAIPASSGDVGNIPNIRLTQYHGTGTYPGNYTGPQVPELIDPADANVVWNPAGAGRWEITFNVIGFSGFYLSSKPIVLPVSLLNFSGRNNGSTNLLEWTTSSEQNSNYFNLQRSTDGINYVNAGTITASGNSNTAKNYYYSDNITAINTTLFYYRLKIVDITGSIKYSPVVKIKLNSKGFNIEATNPFADQLKINIETELSENAVISLKDISGRKLLQKESQLRKGNNALLLTNLAQIPGGVYLLTITTDSQQQTVKVVKQ